MGGRIAPLRTVTLHDLEELNNDLGAGSDQDLTLAGLLGIVDGVESIVENGSADHFGGVVGMEILKSNLEMRYLPMGENMLASRGREQEECPPEMDQRGFCRSFPKKRSVSRASDDQDSTLFCTASQKKRKTLLSCPSSPVAELKIALFYHDKQASSSLGPDRCQFLFVPSQQHTSVIYFVGPGNGKFCRDRQSEQIRQDGKKSCTTSWVGGVWFFVCPGGPCT